MVTPLVLVLAVLMWELTDQQNSLQLMPFLSFVCLLSTHQLVLVTSIVYDFCLTTVFYTFPFILAGTLQASSH